MYISERTMRDRVEMIREHLSDPSTMSEHCKRYVTRKPYHLDNGTNLLLSQKPIRKEGK